MFFVVVVLINIVYLLLLFQFSPGFKKIYDISNFNEKDYEVIVLGNSMALDGIDALYLTQKGLATYNMAVAGNHVSTTLFMLESYLEKNKKPAMVIIGLSSAVGESYLNPVPYHNPEVDFFYKPSLWNTIKNPPLLNFQWLAIDMCKIVISKDHRNAQMIAGQWRTQKVIPDYSTFNASKEHSIDYSNPYLSKIISLCATNSIQVVLIEMTGSFSSRNNLPLQYQTHLADATTVQIYNLNNNVLGSKIINPMTDWLAPDHLNVYGATKQTNYIYNEILVKDFNLQSIITTND